MHTSLTILIRGGGDIATGVIVRLYRAGFRKLLVLEREQPMAVRRKVAFSEAVYEGTATVEGVLAERIAQAEQRFVAWQAGRVPLLVDPQADCLAAVRPEVIVEATLAKRNVGVGLNDAPLVIGLGPGFTVGCDVHRIVETNRGPDLGRVLRAGSAAPNTGIPGDVTGFSRERVLRASVQGLFVTVLDIGDRVEQGSSVGTVDGEPVLAKISGTLRGLLRSGVKVESGTKIGDIEPRPDVADDRVSDKALAVAGGVLESVLEHCAMRTERSGLPLA